MSNKSLSWRDRSLLIVAGFLFVLITTILAMIIEATGSGNQIFDQYVRPFTLAAAGLGTGHYLGRSMREQNSIHIHFAVGFFIGIFIESIAFTFNQGVVIGNTNAILPYPSLAVTAALFALVLHLSPAIPNDDNFTQIMGIFAGPIVTGFLILSSVVEFIISLDVASGQMKWAVMGVFIFISSIGWAYMKGQESAAIDDEDKDESSDSDTTKAVGN